MKALKHTFKNCQGATLIEYAFIAAFAVGAVSAMTIYISRGITSVQTVIEQKGMDY